MASPSSPPPPPPLSPNLPDEPPLEEPPRLTIPQTLWSLRVPLSISHASLPNTPPFLITVPRFSYLPFLIPRLTAYFSSYSSSSSSATAQNIIPTCSSFHHEEILLRNLPLGLLVDLYQPPSLPWRLVVSDGPEWDTADTFTNSAKEADFIRNGNAKQIMSLSKDDGTALWNSVQDNDYAAFARIQARLLDAPTALKHVPIRIYIPSSSSSSSSSAPPAANDEPGGSAAAQGGSFKVVQTLVQPRLQNRTPQTLGTALKSILPTLFPSSRDPILANVIIHGAPVPFRAPLEELMREAAYPDGWLCLIVVLL